MDSTDFDAQVAGVAALAEPVRRALYRYVVAQPGAVSREQAATGVGVAHHVAKFHLDRLEEDGLLEVEFLRPAGRSGPGAGRPAKLYRRSSREFAVSLPERRYDLAGRVMAEAITTAASSGVPVTEALRSAASATGRALGQDAARAAGSRASQAARVQAICRVLADNGYEPRAGGVGIALANCPFHGLAHDYTDLVCGMNLDLICGLVESVGGTQLRPRLDPHPGRCCVTVERVKAD
jgi:predicted ArsR family transcriptional regulator